MALSAGDRAEAGLKLLLAWGINLVVLPYIGILGLGSSQVLATLAR
ncbi:MAG: hypothetical protein ACFB2W_22545 [Leptolyngbyaceae cyanobacterium]